MANRVLIKKAAKNHGCVICEDVIEKGTYYAHVALTIRAPNFKDGYFDIVIKRACGKHTIDEIIKINKAMTKIIRSV
jgi:hypothetical protein